MPGETGDPAATAPQETGADHRFEEAHRLHPSSIVFRLLDDAKRLVLPGLAVLFLSAGGDDGPRWELWLMIFFVPAIAIEAIGYLTYRYRFSRDQLIVTSGVLIRKERHIPFSRVQTIDTTQNVLHRALNVVEARVETAGGNEPEAVLKVLTPEAVETMRQRVLGGRTQSSSEVGGEGEAAESTRPWQTAGEGFVTLGVGEVTLVGMLSLKGLAIFAVLFGLFWEFNLGDRIDFESLFEENLGGFSGLAAVGVWSAIGLGFIGLTLLVSAAWALFRLYGFNLRVHGEDMRLTCGLLTRLSATVPRRRVQLVSVHEPLLYRRMGKAAVRIETASVGGQEGEEQRLSQKWFLPMIPKARVQEAVSLLLPDLPALDELDWRPLAPRAAWRASKRSLIVALVITAFVGILFRPWGVSIGLLLVPLAVLHARAWARSARWAWTGDTIAWRSGVISRRLSIVPAVRAQVVALHEGPFDRRNGHARLEVDTAGAGPAGHKIDIPYLPRPAAAALQASVTRRAAEVALRW